MWELHTWFVAIFFGILFDCESRTDRSESITFYATRISPTIRRNVPRTIIKQAHVEAKASACSFPPVTTTKESQFAISKALN